MQRKIAGVLIFLSSLLVGVQVVSFITNMTEQFSLPREIPEPGFPIDTLRFPTSPVGVHVSYIGVEDSTLRFLIYNGSTETLSCIGYSGICSSPVLRIDGLDAKAWMCMNWSSRYEIRPGDTVELMVFAEDFSRLPGKNDKIVVGFKSINKKEQDLYFAEPIVIPSEFRNEIKKAFVKQDAR